MFLLHEQKLTTTHHEFFNELCNQIPSLHSSKCPIVTDREQSILNAISSSLPNVPLVHCWNHIFRDIRFWLRAQRVPSNDISVYLDDAFRLFHQATPVEYDNLLADQRTTWDAGFEKYYITSIHPQVILDNCSLVIVILFFFSIGESAHWTLGAQQAALLQPLQWRHQQCI